MPDPKTDTDTIEAPPFLRTWPRLYAAVLGYLAALLILLYLATRAFRY